MKLTKLLAIKAETERFTIKLNAAIERAKNDTYSIWDNVKEIRQPKTDEQKGCTNTKESAAFKRSAMDLKREISNL